jgi:hypothetical protein
MRLLRRATRDQELSQKGVEGFTPRYAVCKGAHTAWSNACPARKKEMGRVEQAKQFRNIYWPVLSRDDTSKDNNNTRTRERQTRTPAANRAIRIPDTPILEPSQATTISEPPIAQARDTSPESQASPANIETRALVDRSVAEDWATPATQQEPTRRQSTIDPQMLTTEQSSTHGQAADGILDMETIVLGAGDGALCAKTLVCLDTGWFREDGRNVCIL